MDQLSPLDAAFLDAEDTDRHASLAIASVAVIAGPPPSHEEFVATIGARLTAIRRARQKVLRVPFGLGRPVWVDDPHFEPDYHFRRTALPAPGDDTALHQLIARLMSQRLDRDRPLWENWVIEGLAGGRWAVLTKVHHCMADGVSGTQLYRALYDLTPHVPTASDPAAPPSWQPEPQPGTARLLLGALADVVRSPAENVGLVVGLARSPARAARRLADTAKGLYSLTAAVRPATATSLTGRLGQYRRYGVARAALPALTEIARAHGTTVNDVALTAISAALRELLLHRGETPGPTAVRTLVPVSVRVEGDEGILDNRVSLLLPFLPVDIADPVDALGVVHARLVEAKASREAQAGEALTELAGHEPFGPLSLAIRLAGRLPQRNIITVTTNVPGPPVPLYVLGRELVELLPYVPIAVRLRIGVALMTYCDHAVFGITTDYDSAPEIDLLTAAVERTITQLLATARVRTRTRKPLAHGAGRGRGDAG